MIKKGWYLVIKKLNEQIKTRQGPLNNKGNLKATENDEFCLVVRCTYL